MDKKDSIRVDIFGLTMSTTVSGGGYAIVLKESEGERRLPIIIGHFEAQAIAFELEGVKPPRPLTHDLLKNIVEVLGYRVEYITINELRDSTFYAKIKLDSYEIDEIDARPSDAIAVALKFAAPIYVASEIMDEIGFIPESEQKDGSEQSDNEELMSDEHEELHTDDNKESRLKQLQTDLEDAVNREDYEKAAEIRDEIKKLEISNLN
ncbi:MAG: bifunctional nuclease family protein [Ignavibacteria bacterium]|nr:bifunctional nuclease family protein [Ignavibacteria bacterium]